MIHTLIVIAYCIVGLATLRIVAGLFAWEEKSPWSAEPEGGDWFVGFLVGALAGLCWPALVAGYLAFYAGKRLPIKSPQERLHEKELAEKKLREMERNLGL